jgi:hypothetical protein
MASQNNYSITESNIYVILVTSFIRDKLIKQGYHAIRLIGKNLREMKTYDGYNKIEKDEFLYGLRDLGILLPKVAAEVK